MKTKVLIGALVGAATAAAIYYIRKFRANQAEKSEPVKKSHHLTNAFARAKSQAVPY